MVCEREGEREGEENVRSVRLDMHKKELISVKRDLIRVTHTFSTDDAECALGASGGVAKTSPGHVRLCFS